MEGLRNKLVNKYFLDLLGCLDIFGITESWLGREVREIKGYISYLKERCKIAEYGKKAGGQDISNRGIAISSNVNVCG